MTQYLRVKQNNEYFFITKLSVSELKKYVTFHFRDDGQNAEAYIKSLQKKGLHVEAETKGVQRRVQLKRITDIKNVIDNKNFDLFPTAVILSNNIKDYGDEQELKMYNRLLSEDFDDFGAMDLTLFKQKFSIIDGQHRLGGLFIADDQNTKDLEIPVIILLNAPLPYEAKLFSDINGNQRAVNKSIIYDLYEEMDPKTVDNEFYIQKVCSKLNNSIESPLYKQVKMLGTGKGAISQAFLIQYLVKSIADTNMKFEDVQEIFTQLFYYFKAFQEIFPQDWPLPQNLDNVEFNISAEYKDKFIMTCENKDLSDIDKYSCYVLKIRKSQLVKTNGFGALIKMFPEIYKLSNTKYSGYISIIKLLEGKITWSFKDNESPGTGKIIQERYIQQISDILSSYKK